MAFVYVLIFLHVGVRQFAVAKPVSMPVHMERIDCVN